MSSNPGTCPSSTLNVPSHQEKKETHQFSPILERCHPLEFFNSKCPIRRKKTETHQFSPILNDAIHWSPSTLNVPSGEKNGNTSILSILERCHPLESFNSKCPIRRKKRKNQFSPILERCHPLEFFNSKCPIREKRKSSNVPIWSPSKMSHQEKKWKHINSLQSLNDAIHWSSSTLNVPSGEKMKHINSLQSLNVSSTGVLQL
ncbi:hypothetical protein TNCV_3940341 [Trichonephila clavipes]|uniref:Uncharacterized protein n=1 Tax=Trichonephila clavipes TaxID=2585209 RepID=A0A8X6VVQ4_TRICX|nr:hypothetical protein TNCV_3940341 [Trichonephila clavipes]